MITPSDIVFKTFVIAAYLALSCYGFWFFWYRLQYLDYEVPNNITIDSGIVAADYVEKINYAMLDTGTYMMGLMGIGIGSLVQVSFEIVFLMVLSGYGFCSILKFFVMPFFFVFFTIPLIVEGVSLGWYNGEYYYSIVEYRDGWEEYSSDDYLPPLSCESGEYPMVYDGNITSDDCSVHDGFGNVVTLCCGELQYTDYSMRLVNTELFDNTWIFVGVTLGFYTLEYLVHGLLYGCNGEHKCRKGTTDASGSADASNV